MKKIFLIITLTLAMISFSDYTLQGTDIEILTKDRNHAEDSIEIPASHSASYSSSTATRDDEYNPKDYINIEKNILDESIEWKVTFFGSKPITLGSSSFAIFLSNNLEIKDGTFKIESSEVSSEASDYDGQNLLASSKTYSYYAVNYLTQDERATLNTGKGLFSMNPGGYSANPKNSFGEQIGTSAKYFSSSSSIISNHAPVVVTFTTNRPSTDSIPDNGIMNYHVTGLVKSTAFIGRLYIYANLLDTIVFSRPDELQNFILKNEFVGYKEDSMEFPVILKKDGRTVKKTLSYTNLSSTDNLRSSSFIISSGVVKPENFIFSDKFYSSAQEVVDENNISTMYVTHYIKPEITNLNNSQKTSVNNQLLEKIENNDKTEYLKLVELAEALDDSMKNLKDEIAKKTIKSSYVYTNAENSKKDAYDLKLLEAENLFTESSENKDKDYVDNLLEELKANRLALDGIELNKDTYNPVGKDLSVYKGYTLNSSDAKKMVENANTLPSNTNYEFNESYETSSVEDKTVLIKITYNDLSSETVSATLHVLAQNDFFNPKSNDINVKESDGLTNADAKKAIIDNENIPARYEFVNRIDTNIVGTVNSQIRVIYEDQTTDLVDVVIHVTKKKDNEKYNPQGKDIILPLTKEAQAVQGIDLTLTPLPNTTTYSFVDLSSVNKEEANTYPVQIKVTYADDTYDIVNINIVYREYKDLYTIQTQDINKRVYETLTDEDAKNSIIDTTSLPLGTTYTFKSPKPSMTTPSNRVATIIVTYPDGSKIEKSVNVIIRGYNTDLRPEGGEINVDKNHVLTDEDAKKAIKNTDSLPNGTEYRFERTLSTNNPGTYIENVIITYKDGTSSTVSVKVNVKYDNMTYNPTSNIYEVSKGHILTSDDAKKLIANADELPSNTDYTIKLPLPDTNNTGTHSVVVVITYPDGSSKELISQLIVTSTDVKGGSITVRLNEPLTDDLAKKAIINNSDFPSTTTYKFTDSPLLSTSTKGHYNTIVKVKRDSLPEENVSVVVIVEDLSDVYTPLSTEMTVDKGYTLEDIDAKNLISNRTLFENYVTSFSFENTSGITLSSGTKDVVVVVTYNDGSKDLVNAKVIVRNESTNYTLIPQELDVPINSEISNDDAIRFIANRNLPNTVYYSFENIPSTKTLGSKDVKIIVTFSDNSFKEVITKLNVKSYEEVLNPKAKTLIVDKDYILTNSDASKLIDKSNLPINITYELISPIVDTTKDGTFSQKVKVIYEDNTFDIVTSNIVVNKYNAKYTIDTQMITVDLGYELKTSDISKMIVSSLPANVEYTYAITPDTNNSGHQNGKIRVTFVDGSYLEKDILVNVKSNKEMYDPEANLDNKVYLNSSVTESVIKGFIKSNNLPAMTEYTLKTPLDTTLEGNKNIVVIITYPDKTTDEVNVTVTVTNISNISNVISKDISVNIGSQITQEVLESIVTNYDNLEKPVVLSISNKDEITKTSGIKRETLTLTFKDSSTKDILVNIHVKSYEEAFKPVLEKVIVNINEELTEIDAKKAIKNIDIMPKNTTYEFTDTSKFSNLLKTTRELVITYPDKTKLKVNVDIEVVEPKIDVSRYITQIRKLNIVDNSIINNTNRGIYFNTNLTKDLYNKLRSIVEKQEIDKKTLFGGLNLGYNFNVKENVLLGVFSEYDYDLYHKLSFGGLYKVNFDRQNVLGFVRYRVNLLDQSNQHNFDIYTRYMYAYYSNFFVNLNVGNLLSYSTAVKLDDNTTLNGRFLVHFDTSAKIGFKLSSNTSIYAKQGLEVRISTSQELTAKDKKNTKVENPFLLNAQLELGFEHTFNNFKMSESASFDYDGKLRFNLGFGYNF